MPCSATAYAMATAKLSSPLPVAASAEPVWHLFPVRVAAGRRAEFMAHLAACGVESAVHYPTLICDQPALAAVPFAVYGDLAQARDLVASVVSLPIHPYLSDAEIAHVVASVNSWR